MAHLFDKMNPNFFNVLSAPNKKIYLNCIFIIYHSLDSVENSFQGDREYVMQRLIDYFDDLNETDLVSGDELANQDKSLTSRQKSLAVINMLKRCGWIGEEELGNYRTSLNLFDYSIKIIETLESITKGEYLEYTGDIYTVYTLLKHFNIEEGLNTIEQAFSKTKEISRKLRSLKANIVSYYHDITVNKSSQELPALLEKLLKEYKNNFFDAAYYNLKTKDSLPRYKNHILKNVNKIYGSDEMDLLATMAFDTKKLASFNEGFSYVEDKLRYINETFQTLEHIILSIDRKNEQYISAASAKILFLTNTTANIEGLFDQLFKVILNDKKEYDDETQDIEFDALFNLSFQKNLDDLSVYNQPKARIQSVIEDIVFDVDNFDEDITMARARSIMEPERFGKKVINQFVCEVLLAENAFIEARYVDLSNGEEDLIRLILIFLYSNSLGINYHIEKTDYDVTNNKITFKNFIIRKGLRVHE